MKRQVGQDQVWGYVRAVHDGDTFSLHITSQSGRNQYNYRDQERVRLKGVNAPELGSRGAQAATRRLAQLSGQRVRCFVHGRDVYGRLICDVSRAPSDYAR